MNADRKYYFKKVCWICEIVKRPCIHGDQVLAMSGRPCQEYNVMHIRPEGIR